jgi:predicted P-loop ATPase
MSGIPWANILSVTERNGIRATIANVVAILQHDPQWGPTQLYYDSFLDRVMMSASPPRAIRDEDITRITVAIQSDDEPTIHGISEGQVASAVNYVARQRERHCVRDYLHSLKDDDEPRIDRLFLDYFGARPSADQSESYVLACGRHFFLSIVARAMTPGCQLDTMIVLEGAQGIGKSKALRTIGGPWYVCCSESMAGKDFLQILPGGLIIEVAEFSAASRADVERKKVMVSTPSDTYRASYARFARTVPRQCVLVATTNRDDYLDDDTGGRRFLPVRCGAIDVEALARDRDALFAEATRRWATEPYWFHETDESRTIQASRRPPDVWLEPIRDFLVGKPDLTIRDILVECLKSPDLHNDARSARRVGSVLRALGWKGQSIRRGLGTVYGFVPGDAD